MADYDRSTATIRLDALPGVLRDALTEHAAARQLTLGDTTVFLTTSRRLKKPGLVARMTGAGDPDSEHLTALVIGARDVLVGIHGEERGTSVLSARLEDVTVAGLADQLAGTGIDVDDTGVTINGFAGSVEGVARPGSFFFGLGPPDVAWARRALEDAVRAAKA
ncbi:MAG TPA: hypothetical protein VD790_06175 [Thermoleophilaceae bacterium]|nr:hypothetical protein [Thermoleophilaceae bacterium]